MIIDLTGRIKVVRPQEKSKFPYSNSVLVEDEERIVIDAGAGGRAYADICPEAVDLLLLSHIHFDHIHGAGLFMRAEMMAGDEEAGAYRDPAEYSKYSGFVLWDQLMSEPLDNSLAIIVSSYDDVKRPDFADFRVNGRLYDGMRIPAGHTEITALHTPGHSPGHYAFYFEKEGILFSCDLDLAPKGPWYGGVYCDAAQVEESIRRLMEISPSVLVTSHRRVFDWQKDNVPALFQQYLDVMLRREERLISYLREPRSLSDLARQEFKLEGHPHNILEVFWTKIMFLKHLEKMEKTGRVFKIGSERWAMRE